MTRFCVNPRLSGCPTTARGIRATYASPSGRREKDYTKCTEMGRSGGVVMVAIVGLAWRHAWSRSPSRRTRRASRPDVTEEPGAKTLRGTGFTTTGSIVSVGPVGLVADVGVLTLMVGGVAVETLPERRIIPERISIAHYLSRATARGHDNHGARARWRGIPRITFRHHGSREEPASHSHGRRARAHDGGRQAVSGPTSLFVWRSHQFDDRRRPPNDHGGRRRGRRDPAQVDDSSVAAGDAQYAKGVGDGPPGTASKESASERARR